MRRRCQRAQQRWLQLVRWRVLRSGEPVYVVTSDAPESQQASDSMRELGLRTVLCAPLSTEGGRIGVLYVDARKGDQEVREGSLPFFSALAKHIALAVENARLRARLTLEG